MQPLHLGIMGTSNSPGGDSRTVITQEDLA
jgi:hypothetical protein